MALGLPEIKLPELPQLPKPPVISFDNVSMQKPFGDSTLAQVGGQLQQAAGMDGNNTTIPDPISSGKKANKFLNGIGINVNPSYSTPGSAVAEYVDKQSGGKLDTNPEHAPLSMPSLTASKPPIAGLLATNLSGGGGGGTINGLTAGGLQARALEESLRSSKRQSLTPNVEYGFNLQKNPIASSAVRKGV